MSSTGEGGYAGVGHQFICWFDGGGLSGFFVCRKMPGYLLSVVGVAYDRVEKVG